MKEKTSLKSRLSFVFSSLMLLAILFCALVLLEQNRVAAHRSQVSINAHRDLMAGIQLREDLSEIDRQASAATDISSLVDRFRAKLDALSRVNHSFGIVAPEAREIVPRLEQAFRSYSTALANGSRSNEARIRYDDAAAAIGALVDLNENQVYRMAESMRSEQERSLKLALSFLAIFIVIVIFAGYRIISFITEPLASLSKFLDQVHVEDDLPYSVPSFETEAAEVAVLAKSFEELLNRLRGYKSLNVRRLLIEKRRADLIAASITDGIFLLRGEEVLYMNPVGEKIISGGGGASTRGPFQKSLHLRKELENNPGTRAVLAAISQSIPVEFILETPDTPEISDRKHYLIQAQPIPNSIIEQYATPTGPADGADLSDDSGRASVDRVLERFQPTTVVLAQDVTIVRESQDAKSHFIGTLSHEVKTPVTSLTMATRLLKRVIGEIPNPSHRTLIETCAENVDRLRVLLEDLLKISAFDTLTQRLEFQSIDLPKLVRNTVQSLQVNAAEKGIELVSELPPPIVNKDAPAAPVLSVDAAKVTWALSNILTNALRHTPRNGRVVVQVERLEDAFQVSIRDTGPGIDPKRQTGIFDKFNPYYDLRVARSGSAGIGLAIAREIVVAHGGRIWVTSKLGLGAEFSFTLPFKRIQTDPKFRPRQSVLRLAPVKIKI